MINNEIIRIRYDIKDNKRTKNFERHAIMDTKELNIEQIVFLFLCYATHN